MSILSDLLNAARDNLDTARYELRESSPLDAWTYVGEASRLLQAAVDSLTPPEPPRPLFISPIPNGAVFGRTKWYPGYGCDLFLPRGTPVLAPADCVVEEVLGGSGLQGGDELILSLSDKSWAWRYRHTQALVRVGQSVRQGDQVGIVNDPSLDQLGRVPAWAGVMPDDWQHLDLSVNRGTDHFSATGGIGGNTSAYQWMMNLGYSGRELYRTPGPPDAGR